MKRVLPAAGLQGPQHYWSVMVALSAKGGFTISDVHGRTNGCSLSTVKDYVRRCASLGHVEPVEERRSIKNRPVMVYRVVDGRVAAPIIRRESFADQRGRQSQQLWTAMRGLKLFTAREVAIAASTPEVPVSEKAARAFIGFLTKGGYLAETTQRTRPGQQARWKLLPAFNTGPLAPASTERGTVLFDRNLQKAVNLNAPEASGRAA
ncbi:MAG: hypothetical protein DI527_07510 [Chelatococcus sp.]|nr:MAG: hypothetical protein DI527_07510 [Chelatococcus sp.]